MTIHSDGPPADRLTATSATWHSYFFRSGSFTAPVVIVLTLIGVGLAVGTMVALNRASDSHNLLIPLLIADFAYLILLFGLIAWRVFALIGTRRSTSAGAALHLRLTGIFAVVAIAPTIMVAVFAAVSLYFGFEAQFSNLVRSVVNNSEVTAQAYKNERLNAISGAVFGFAFEMNRAAALGYSDVALREHLRRQQRLRQFPEAYLINGDRKIVGRGEFSYQFTYDEPSEDRMATARLGDLVVFEDYAKNEVRALYYLNEMQDTYLYVSRPLDRDVLDVVERTAEAVREYRFFDESRGQVVTQYALLYLGFAILVITAAIWLGLWFAERLSRPIGVLAGAAQRVGEGDLDVKVPENSTGDEVALLSSVFNRMTAQVKGQRDALVSANRESEERRNFTETVLSGVSAGVIGLDADGGVELVNAAARTMLGIETDPTGKALEEIAPNALEVFEKAATSVSGSALSQIEMTINGVRRELLIRVSARSSRDIDQGFVMTIDDLTALVSAQREAAWGDVARRIAHEIKNPLTPIQLSAERLKRKFSKLGGEDTEALNRYADVIVRQAGDIRRMVDEFSRFARMPEPNAETVEIVGVVRDAILLQSAAREDVAFEQLGDEGPLSLNLDKGMMHQALTNLLKNACEAIDGRIEREPDFAGQGRVRVTVEIGDTVAMSIEDNGVGLPAAERARLTEPYVTTREKGTGLGLAIVKKIAEQHQGALTLEDAAPFEDGAHRGAKVTLTLPAGGMRRAGEAESAEIADNKKTDKKKTGA